jgi:hypothetical protein
MRWAVDRVMSFRCLSHMLSWSVPRMLLWVAFGHQLCGTSVGRSRLGLCGSLPDEEDESWLNDRNGISPVLFVQTAELPGDGVTLLRRVQSRSGRRLVVVLDIDRKYDGDVKMGIRRMGIQLRHGQVGELCLGSPFTRHHRNVVAKAVPG